MRWAVLLLLVGCRQIFGIDDPHVRALDASLDAPAIDAPIPDTTSCEVLPMVPASPLVETLNAGATKLTITNFKLGMADVPYIVVAAGDSFLVNFGYTWVDASCSGSCVDQIEIGYTPGDRVGCPFDGAVMNGLMQTGMRTYAMTAPAIRGWTSIRIAIGQNFSCTAGGAHTWYEGPPPEADIAGYVCVY